ncbi:MAG: aminoglycoside phosphotransferase family protein, partial [Candidatus Glassbacteria bacterium]|nr:aminoglycoside phosphotransferase family protein [Candidatus Glassbacteria bacterium]
SPASEESSIRNAVEEIPLTLLRETAAARLEADPETISLKRCNTGKFNTTYFVGNGPGTLVLRLAPPDDPAQNLFYEYRMMRQEPSVHQILRQRTEAPVPEILAHDFSHERIPRDYLLMELLPGVPLSEHSSPGTRDLGETLFQVGAALKTVHAVHGGSYGYLGGHRPMEPQPDWTGAFAVMWNKLLDDIRRCGGYSESEADSLRRLLDSHLGAFTRSEPSSLLHMDVWAQNILTDERGSLTGLLDWDRACWGDPEIEFAVLDYCGISEPAFWEGYGSRRETDRPAQTRRLFYLLYELQKYIFIRRVRGRNPALAERYRLQALELASSALGLRP